MRTWISRRLRPLLAASAVPASPGPAWSQREAIASFDWSIDHGLLALAVALFAVAPLLQGLTFALGLRRIGAGGSAGALARMWARSFLLRYEPSGVVGFAYRVTARERVGASTAQVMTVTGYEQLAVVVAGAAAAMAGFLGAGVHPPVLAIVLFVAALVAAVAARPAFVGGWLHDRLRARGIETAGPLRGRTLALMVALDAAGWVATGLGAWALARALGATAGLDAFLLLGAFALSWLLGVLVPLAPGGLGLREGSLILSLGAAVGAGPGHGAGARAAPGLLRRRARGDRGRRAGRAGARAARRPPRRARRPTPPALPAARPQRHDRRRPDLLRGARPSRASSSASPRPASSCSWSTTPRPTAPASWPTRWPPSARGCTSCTAPARTASAWPTAPASRGAWSAATASSARWTRTSPTRPRSSPRCSRCSTRARPTSCSATATCPAAARPAGRRPAASLSRMGCTGSKLVLGLPFDDLSGGFKLWRASTLAELDFDSMLATGYAFQVETTQLAYLMGKRIEEVPFVFSERIAGESKMTLAVSLEGIRVTFALRRRARGRGLLVAVTSARPRETRPAGFEPATSSSGGTRSIQLS